MRWLLWCFCLLAESYETINHYHYHYQGSEDTDNSLVYKKILSPQNGSLSWCPAPGILGQIGKNMPSIDNTRRKPQSRNEKIFFQSNLYSLPNPWRVWTLL